MRKLSQLALLAVALFGAPALAHAQQFNLECHTRMSLLGDPPKADNFTLHIDLNAMRYCEEEEGDGECRPFPIVGKTDSQIILADDRSERTSIDRNTGAYYARLDGGSYPASVWNGSCSKTEFTGIAGPKF